MSPRSPQSPSVLSSAPKTAARAALAGVLLTLTACQDPHEKDKEAVLTTSTGGTTAPPTPTSSGGVDTTTSSHTTTEDSSTTVDTTTSGTTADTTGTSGDSTTTDGTGDTTDTGAVEPPPECTEHADCASEACKILEGKCFDEDYVMVVKKGDAGPDCNDNYKTSDPFCDVNVAIQHAIVTASSYDWVIRVEEGEYSLNGGNDISAELTGDLAIIAAPSEGKKYVPIDDTTSLFDIKAGSNTVYIDGFDLSRVGIGQVPIIESEGGNLVITNSIVHGSKNAPGLSVKDTNVSLKGVAIHSNSWAVVADGGNHDAENTLITGNGNGETEGGGLKLTGGTFVGNYVTILDNRNTGNILSGNADSMQCDGTSGTVRNSVIAQYEDSIRASAKCPAVVYKRSLLDEEKGPSNVLKASANIANLFTLQDGVAKWKADWNFPEAMPAVWESGDPTEDYLGNLRPTIKGTQDYPGATRYFKP